MSKIDGVVDDVEPLTDRISAFRLTSASGGPLPAWDPGAHIEVETAGGSRAYSLIAFDPVPAAPKTYTIAVQQEVDGTRGSRAMHA